jgi:hypothetical protein
MYLRRRYSWPSRPKNSLIGIHEPRLNVEKLQDVSDQLAERVASSVPWRPLLGVAEALADPIIQAVMTADRIDHNEAEALLRRVGARLANRARSGDGRSRSW